MADIQLSQPKTTLVEMKPFMRCIKDHLVVAQNSTCSLCSLLNLRIVKSISTAMNKWVNHEFTQSYADSHGLHRNYEADSHKPCAVQALSAQMQAAYFRGSVPQNFPFFTIGADSTVHYNPSSLQSHPELAQFDQARLREFLLSGTHLTLPQTPVVQITVPQEEYKPRGKDFVAHSPPVCFFYEGMGGIPLQDALDGKYKGLHNRDDPVFAGCGSSISLRIQIIGYAPWSRQIKTMDWCSPPKPITLAKLSTEIAKAVKSFIEDNRDVVSSCPDWRVGRSALTLDCFILKSLVQVSRASFQPVFILNSTHPYVLTKWVH